MLKHALFSTNKLKIIFQGSVRCTLLNIHCNLDIPALGNCIVFGYINSVQTYQVSKFDSYC